MIAAKTRQGGKFKNLLSNLWACVSPRLLEPEIDRHFVSSNAIATLGYDEKKRCLQVEYFNGLLYRIDDVSRDAYDALQSTEAFDHVFQKQICSTHQMTRIGSLLPIYR